VFRAICHLVCTKEKEKERVPALGDSGYGFVKISKCYWIFGMNNIREKFECVEFLSIPHSTAVRPFTNIIKNDNNVL
jgi:hypothetical protein